MVTCYGLDSHDSCQKTTTFLQRGSNRESKSDLRYNENEKLRNNNSRFSTMKVMEIGKTKDPFYIKTFSFVY